MNNKFRLGLIIIFILGGIFLIYLNITKPPKSAPLYIKFKLESGTPRTKGTEQYIKIDRAGFYSFHTVERILGDALDASKCPLEITFDNFSITTDKNPIFKAPIYIEKPCTLRIKFKSVYPDSYHFVTKISIEELPQQEKPKEYFIPVSLQEYGGFSFNVEKGMYYYLDNPDEPFLIGYFKGERLAHEEPLWTRRKAYSWDTDRPAYSGSFGEIRYTRNENILLFFWNTCTVKFKSAEVPFLLLLSEKPSHEKYKINDKYMGHAIYMDDNQVLETEIWLDEGDRVRVKEGNFHLTTKNKQITTDFYEKAGIDWSPNIKSNEIFANQHYCKSQGFLQIKAVGMARLNEITFWRNKKWEFKITPEQIYKEIKVYPGDRLLINATERYFLNGELQDKGSKYKDFSKEEILEFKGSVEPVNIAVSVLIRRGV